MEALTNPKTPRGCLAVQGALACGDAAESVRKELCARRGQAESLLRDRFIRARNEGDLPKTVDPADLAKYATTVLNGLSVQASSGATRGQLRKVADLALRAWPE